MMLPVKNMKNSISGPNNFWIRNGRFVIMASVDILFYLSCNQTDLSTFYCLALNSLREGMLICSHVQ